MKRGFEENVPRVRPRVRLGGSMGPQASGSAMEATEPQRDEARDEHAHQDALAQQEAERAREDDLPGDGHHLAETVPPPGRSLPPPPQTIPAPPREARFHDDGAEAFGSAPHAEVQVGPPKAQARADETASEELARLLALSSAEPGRARKPLRKPGAATQVAALARELTAELNQAAEANARLKADLDSAVAALRRAAEEAREAKDEREQLARELAARESREGELQGELELVEAERDGAQAQAARVARELREARVRADEKAAEAARAQEAAAQARESAERLAKELQARAEERDGARTELLSARAERDSLSEALLAARADADDAVESRNALEEIHRALNEARTRVARLR